MNLLGEPDCERCGHLAAGYVTDDTDAAWLCRGHLRAFLILAWSNGRTVGWYLREAA